MPERVGPVDEPPHVVGRAVTVERGEEVDAVITPAERPGNSATGMTSTAVTPSSASLASSLAAAAQVPSRVNVPRCSS